MGLLFYLHLIKSYIFSSYNEDKKYFHQLAFKYLTRRFLEIMPVDLLEFLLYCWLHINIILIFMAISGISGYTSSSYFVVQPWSYIRSSDSITKRIFTCKYKHMVGCVASDNRQDTFQ